MSKFKVGQQVRILARGQAPPLFGVDSNDWIGEIGKVERYNSEEGYWVVNIGVDNRYDWFNEDALEAV